MRRQILKERELLELREQLHKIKDALVPHGWYQFSCLKGCRWGSRLMEGFVGSLGGGPPQDAEEYVVKVIIITA